MLEVDPPSRVQQERQSAAAEDANFPLSRQKELWTEVRMLGKLDACHSLPDKKSTYNLCIKSIFPHID